ncbi:uncharacterized protein LOC113381717 [Ctenocephalides felis]|uniref:uncharacterized protein LOC113381717 n=1 Tax=Ctenocephalides felis TaxID=7515 RepID=UPI000E6E5247|nr:uncharacterized protein LOC113381717 [Ctenocephalides felis]
MFKHLSAGELLFEHSQYAKLKPKPRKETKFVSTTEVLDIKEKTESYLSETYSFIKASRVEKVEHLSVAEWLPEENVAVVTRQVSKIWATIGTKVCTNRSI